MENGSICEMLNKVLIESGYKVGKFISPHLIKFNDEITINNNEIPDEAVEDIISRLDPLIKKYDSEHEIPVKWFEVITSLAIIYFYEQNCDIAILEVGLGGLLDCTNIIEKPIASIIGNIGYDHMDILGSTIEEITKQKAGIIKQDSNTVIYYQENVTPIIEEICKEKQNALHIIYENEIKNYSSNMFLQKFDFENFKDIEINLKGKIQISNACVCLKTIEILNKNGFNISLNAIKLGMKNIIHKARFEILKENPTIIFDGGHNENAILNLKENLNLYYPNRKIIYIVSLLQSKDYKTVIKHLVNTNNSVFYFTNGNISRPYVPAEVLLDEADKNNINKNILYAKNLENAIYDATSKYKNDIICICGSFYVYKDVLEIIK